MDIKGIAWVGNIYQKFESLCLEVEEIMYQDTVDFMENQVQTVGASVKKFYSGVMTDLLPPFPNDSGKKETSETDLQECKDSEIITKSKFHIKETLKREIDQVRKRSNVLGHVERKKNKQHSEVAQQMDRLGMSEKTLTETGSSVPERQVSAGNTESHLPVEKTVEEFENRTDPSCDLAASTQDNCSDIGKVSVVEPSTLGDTQRRDTDETIISFELELSFTDSNFQKLEESCIFVDGDELSFVALDKGKRKLYKKKLQYAFSPRKRSSRAQEYKQLAVKYLDNNARSNQEQGSNVNSAKPEGSSAQFHQVGESEWELL